MVSPDTPYAHFWGSSTTYLVNTHLSRYFPRFVYNKNTNIQGREKLKRLFMALVFMVSMTLTACSPGQLLGPTLSPIPTSTTSPIPTLTPTLTPIKTSTHQPTGTPEPPEISSDMIFFRWGENYDWKETTSPYLLWGASLRDVMNGNCQGFICDGKDLREYDPNVWFFLGSGEYGKRTFTFEKPLDTFVLVWNNKIGFDALSGTTADGRIVAYGYLANGEITASYMDGSGEISMKTILNAENNGVPVKTPCGIIDPNPNGDKSIIVTGDYQGWLGGAIVWNFLDQPFSSAFSTRKGYSLTSLTIVSQEFSTISPNQICP